VESRIQAYNLLTDSLNEYALHDAPLASVHTLTPPSSSHSHQADDLIAAPSPPSHLLVLLEDPTPRCNPGFVSALTDATLAGDDAPSAPSNAALRTLANSGCHAFSAVLRSRSARGSSSLKRCHSSTVSLTQIQCLPHAQHQGQSSKLELQHEGMGDNGLPSGSLLEVCCAALTLPLQLEGALDRFVQTVTEEACALPSCFLFSAPSVFFLLLLLRLQQRQVRSDSHQSCNESHIDSCTRRQPSNLSSTPTIRFAPPPLFSIVLQRRVGRAPAGVCRTPCVEGDGCVGQVGSHRRRRLSTCPEVLPHTKAYRRCFIGL
jgi:hypothetical protein